MSSNEASSARARGVRSLLAITDMQQLRHDFPGFEVALQSRQAAGAKRAGHCASYLRGDADRLARGFRSDAFLRRANDHGFN
jgi:hypothetical protein